MDLDGDFFSDDDGLDDLPAAALQELEANALQFTQAVAQRKPENTQQQIPIHHPQQQQRHVGNGEHADWQGAGRVGASVSVPAVDADDTYGDFQFEDDDLDYTEVTNEQPGGGPVARPPVVVGKDLARTGHAAAAAAAAAATTSRTGAPRHSHPQQHPHQQHPHQQHPHQQHPHQQHPHQQQRHPHQQHHHYQAGPSQPPFHPPVGQSRPPLPPSQAVRHLPPPSQPASRYQPSHPHPPSTRYHPPRATPSAPAQTGSLTQNPHPYPYPHQSQPPPEDILSALRQQVRALEADLNAARGEVSIIRANAAKTAKSHEDEIARIERLGQEQVAERERAVEAALAAEKTATTQLLFLRQDVRDIAQRPAVTTPKKNKAWDVADEGFDEDDIMARPTPSKRKMERTPSRNKRKRIMDSPVKPLDIQRLNGGDGEASAAARAGGAGAENWEGRRGRELAVDRDVVMVDVAQQVDAVRQVDPARQADTAQQAQQQQQPAVITHAPSFDFLHLLLDHGIPAEPPTFESLSQLTLPSAPEISLALIIIHKLPLMGEPDRPIQLLVDFAEFATGLWGQCYDEGVLSPAGDHLVSLLEFVLQLQATTVAPLIIRSVVPIACSSLLVVVEGRNRGVELAGIDPSRVLSLLYLVALACASAPVIGAALPPSPPSATSPPPPPPPPLLTFWSLVPIDLVLLLLSPRQRLDDVLGMLDLLCTSASRTTIGPVVSEAEDAEAGAGAGPGAGAGAEAEAVARVLVERVSAKLVELPVRIPATSGSGRERERLGARDRLRLRLAALRTLGSFLTSDVGIRAIKAHENAIPRIVTLLSGSVDELYDLDISPSESFSGSNPDLVHFPHDIDRYDCYHSSSVDPGSHPDADAAAAVAVPSATAASNSPHAPLLYRAISNATRLLHALVTVHEADIQSRLTAAHGGAQRYIVTLTRLHFADEDGVLEGGVGPEAMALAHELLEMAVTPDEGEGIAELFVGED